MENSLKFRDYDIRVWSNGDLSMDAKDMGCFVSNTHIGVQTNITDNKHQAEVERLCCEIRERFKELNNILDIYGE